MGASTAQVASTVAPDRAPEANVSKKVNTLVLCVILLQFIGYAMELSPSKTKLIGTIGPASDAPQTLEQMIRAGLNVARLNFSHGDTDYHRELIRRVRAASVACGQRVAIMGDLPGPKMRIGEVRGEPHELRIGDLLTLTTVEIEGDRQRVSVSFPSLPRAVKTGDTLYLNDGFIQLKVAEVVGQDVHCRVQVGGELRSRKGLNLPGIDLGISAFTDEDRKWVEFAAENGVDALSQSFVSTAADVVAARETATALDYRPFTIAKIERMEALTNLEAILRVADGIMVARGDLGVEIPIESMAVTQKRIMERAKRLGKPVITATQMLESMVTHRRPTRAEATDVANAILDGTDCVMLSAESAMGRYPVEAVSMLAQIARMTEPHNAARRLEDALKDQEREGDWNTVDLIALSVAHTLRKVDVVGLCVPTLSGSTVRNITRFRLPTWITAFSPRESTCQALQFSYGVQPMHVDEDRPDWSAFTRHWLREQGVREGLAILTQGPSQENPCGNHRMELLELDPDSPLACG
jgi:pyruvate kinase